MGIVIKFILKNIYEKKFRTFLLVFSVMMSSALFFSSLAIGDNVVNMFMSQSKQFFGSADIIIQSNEKSPSPFFNINRSDVISDKAEYIIGAVQGIGIYKHKRNETVIINLRGTSIKDFSTMSPLYLDGNVNPDTFTGNRIIISKNASEKYGLRAGDYLNIDVNKTNYKFYICGVAQSTGYFSESGQSLNAIVPRNTLASIYGYPNLINTAFIKLHSSTDTQQAINKLGDTYKRYTVKEPVSREELEQEVGSMSVGFMMMTVVVLFMSVFIIYTSFKVITMERLPVIGTFRSVGATRRTTDLVLMLESFLYGIIGGSLGCLSGIGILFLITMAITPPWMQDYKITLDYNYIQLLAAFLLAAVLSIVSSLIPIIRVSRIPVKEIVLNTIEKKRKNSSWKYILGIVLLIISIILLPISPKNLAVIIDTTSMILSIVAVILEIPLITAVFIKLFEVIYTKVFGNIGVLAAKNLRENKNIMNNISLLAIGISSLIMITTVSDSVMTEVGSFFTRSTTFEIWMYVDGAGRSFEPSLLATEGVKGVYGNYEFQGAEVVGRNYEILVVQGIDSNKYLEFMNTDINGDKKALLHELDSGRNIIVTNMIREKLGISKGDFITLKMNKSNVKYKVIGFHNTLMDNGSNALISDKYFKIDTGTRYYTNIYIKTDKDPSEVADTLRAKYARMQPYLMTMAELEKMNYEMNSKIFNSMKAFSIMTLVIGIFGIFNNYIISFLERKRYLAMYRSIGMSKRQTVKMLFVEALTGGIIGASLGLLTGFLMIYCIPFVMKAIDQPIPVLIKPQTLIISFVAGLLITLVASISPISKSSRLKIIEALKYE